jgi:spore photoproduct lyase
VTTKLFFAPDLSPKVALKLWKPQRVLITPAARQEPFAQRILERVKSLGIPVEELPANRLTGLRGEDERATYNIAKRTLAIVNAPPSQFKLQPIPPSADWQFHLAEGCPAHCQYCYLAGSLGGPPVVRVFANLPQILENTRRYEYSDRMQSFEASCYTDPLSLEHLTGSLSAAISHFGARPNAHLRFVSKFDNVEPLLNLEHNGCTRARISLNAELVSRLFEGGTASLESRLGALRKLALPRENDGGSYPVGVVLAPIMPLQNWEDEYGALFQKLKNALDFPCDLTFECITHRFTPGSKHVLQGWYPKSKLDMNEEARAVKRGKFGAPKYVLRPETMRAMRRFFEREIERWFPQARLLYWT